MANTVLVKMGCNDIRIGNQGLTEDVYLEAVATSDDTQDNASSVKNERGKQPTSKCTLTIRRQAAKGQFKVGQNYSLAFTEVT